MIKCSFNFLEFNIRVQPIFNKIQCDLHNRSCWDGNIIMQPRIVLSPYIVYLSHINSSLMMRKNHVKYPNNLHLSLESFKISARL